MLAYRAPNYIRTRSILAALRQIPEFEIYPAINMSTGLTRYFQTYHQARAIKSRTSPDIYLLGFRGHEFYWPLRRMVGAKPIIVDAMMSPYASLLQERKLGPFGALAAKPWGFIERSILRNADLVLTDTAQHARFYEHEFGLPPAKVLPIPVGAEEPSGAVTVEKDRVISSESPMTVLFYGSFLPLHGVSVILEAAAAVRDLPIRFDFIGGTTKQTSKLHEACSRLGITRYTHKQWLPFEQLINVTIPGADLCLGGPFGNTSQARRVITGKTSQSLALGKPTVIGWIDEDTGFEDRRNCLLVPQGNGKALAETLRWAFDQRQFLPQIGQRGKALYSETLSVDVIRQRLQKAILNLSVR